MKLLSLFLLCIVLLLAAVIDINTATETELRTIPGIGEAYAKKIIAGRPYRAKNELVQKKILPQGVYDKVKDQIVAKQK
jgi:competence protein ComEA